MLTESNSSITKAPNFNLVSTITGQEVSLQDVQGEKGTVVMFICNHCPFVKHIIEQAIQIGNEYKSKGIGFVAISSNDAVEYPQDGPDKMKELAANLDFPFDYLYDESQEIAKAYQAQCTPEFYVFDINSNLFYHGQLDNSRPGNDQPINGSDLRKALDELLNNQELSFQPKPSIGCNIKWK